LNVKQVKSRNFQGVLQNNEIKTQGKSFQNMLLQIINKTDKSNKIININKLAPINDGIFSTYNNKSRVKNVAIPINKKNGKTNKLNNDNELLNKVKITSDFITNPKININEYNSKFNKNIEFKTFSNILNKNLDQLNEKENKNKIKNAMDLLSNTDKQR